MKIVQIFFPPIGGMYALTDDGRLWMFDKEVNRWILSKMSTASFVEPVKTGEKPA